MLEALVQCMGIVSHASNAVGITAKTHYKWMKDDPEYKKEVEEIKNIALDYVETKMMKRIEEGSDTMIIFYLKCKGKERGYIDRQEVQHNIEPIQFIEQKTYEDKNIIDITPSDEQEDNKGGI